MRTFYIIWNMSRKPGTHLHVSKQLATEEVNRLQEQNPGDIFVILKSISYNKAKVTFEQVDMSRTPERTAKKKESCMSRRSKEKPVQHNKSNRFDRNDCWIGLYGDSTKIEVLTNEHLINIISMLERRSDRIYESMLRKLHKHKALHRVSNKPSISLHKIIEDIHYLEMNKPDVYEHFPIMYDLIREKIRRGL